MLTHPNPYQMIAQSDHNQILLVQAPGGCYIVKRLQTSANQQARLMLSQEVRALQALRHPAIPSFLGQPSPTELAISFIQGETLGAYLRRNGPLPWQQACSIALNLTRILVNIHWQKWLHRDIKPSNILLTGTGHSVALIDFGNAIQIGTLPFLSPLRYNGTRGYAAPEQYEGSGYRGAHKAQTDFFSLGVVLHQMLTGHNPRSLPVSLLFDFPPVEQLAPFSPPILVQLVEALLQRDLSQRPSGLVVQQYLERLLYGSTL
ncbi:hypothetical protein KSF_109100 [Reticulibacter mediterranei]|uniref:Protein kinase domain-containing protein n=1 Tax=Reticulibacter mediterranei TaxID=2778369 RepID=A0A8J3NAX4_9CHLR|nr:serine/threonine-protein kinase [Reticulibacter mediterranei]GHP00863.1 hypothetical protein KSF_109100 [Reticulibacter mediterranei]